MWTTFFFVSTAILCSLCLTGCVFVVQRAAADAELQRKKLRSCESRIESISNSLEMTNATLTELANRVKMQKVRNAVNHAAGSSGEPDPYTQPDQWRAMMTRRMAMAKVGVKQ